MNSAARIAIWAKLQSKVSSITADNSKTSIHSGYRRLDARLEGALPINAGRCTRRLPKKVQEAVHVDTINPSVGDPNVQFVAVPGTRGHEVAPVIRTPNGTTLVLNDRFTLEEFLGRNDMDERARESISAMHVDMLLAYLRPPAGATLAS